MQTSELKWWAKQLLLEVISLAVLFVMLRWVNFSLLQSLMLVVLVGVGYALYRSTGRVSDATARRAASFSPLEKSQFNNYMEARTALAQAQRDAIANPNSPSFRLKADALKSRLPTAQGNPLENKYFHSFTDDGNVEWRGRVTGEVGNGFFLIEILGFPGKPIHQRVVELEGVKDWVFYDDEAPWLDAGYRYGQAKAEGKNQAMMAKDAEGKGH